MGLWDFPLEQWTNHLCFLSLHTSGVCWTPFSWDQFFLNKAKDLPFNWLRRRKSFKTKPQGGKTKQLLASQYITQVPSTCNHPELRLLFDFANNDHSWGSNVPKDPSISLLPHFPGYKHHEWGHFFPIWRSFEGDVVPPFLNCAHVCPFTRPDVIKANPCLHRIPNRNRQTTLKKKVGRCFLNLVAKRA